MNVTHVYYSMFSTERSLCSTNGICIETYKIILMYYYEWRKVSKVHSIQDNEYNFFPVENGMDRINILYAVHRKEL